jgi:hypothetical protein
MSNTQRSIYPELGTGHASRCWGTRRLPETSI